MASHIKVVAILMIVQGALETIMGAFFAIMGPLMFGLTKWTSTLPGGSPPPPDFNLSAGLISGIYLALGLPVLAVGIFRIIAGIRNLKYRGRVMGIVALALGAVSFMTCYCMPTSIALLVYGLITYLDEQSKRAFALGEQGQAPEAILLEVLRPPDATPYGTGRFGG
jgi:hypothetical protein